MSHMKVAPLSGTFMIASMLGFIISVFWVYPRWKPYGAAFAIIVIIMFVASIISMTYAPAEQELQIDEKRKK